MAENDARLTRNTPKRTPMSATEQANKSKLAFIGTYAVGTNIAISTRSSVEPPPMRVTDSHRWRFHAASGTNGDVCSHCIRANESEFALIGLFGGAHGCSLGCVPR